MTSKLSSAKPGGSIFAWQAAQVSLSLCLAKSSRMVLAPRVSGSTPRALTNADVSTQAGLGALAS